MSPRCNCRRVAIARPTPAAGTTFLDVYEQARDGNIPGRFAALFQAEIANSNACTSYQTLKLAHHVQSNTARLLASSRLASIQWKTCLAATSASTNAMECSTVYPSSVDCTQITPPGCPMIPRCSAAGFLESDRTYRIARPSASWPVPASKCFRISSVENFRIVNYIMHQIFVLL